MTIDSLALDVSGACNLACRYCFENAAQPARHPMPEATLAAAWRLLFPDGRPRQGCSIRLGSGEPLLAMQLLRRIDSLIRDSGGSAAEGRPAVFLTTNGSLATEEIRAWLVASGWYVKVSVDGPPAVQDRWRPDRSGGGTSARVNDVLADLATRMPDRLSAAAVLFRGAEPRETFDFIAGLGVRRIELVPAAHTDPGILPGPRDAARYDRFVRGYARQWFEGARPPMLVRFETCVQKGMGYRQAPYRCGAGRSFFAVGAGGELYPCLRFTGLPRYRVGSVFDGLDEAAAGVFQRGLGRAVAEREPCRACRTASLCGGPCFAVAGSLGPAQDRPLPIHCAFVEADVRAARWLLARLRANPEPLLSFLPARARALARLV